MFHTDAAGGAGTLLPREWTTSTDVPWQRGVPVVHPAASGRELCQDTGHGLFGTHRAVQPLLSGVREGLEPFTLQPDGLSREVGRCMVTSLWIRREA